MSTIWSSHRIPLCRYTNVCEWCNADWMTPGAEQREEPNTNLKLESDGAGV